MVVIRRKPGPFAFRLPDGMNDLADHNLITFKSYQEPFDAWTVKELIGHYVNYRKQITPAKSPLEPESSFRLFGVTARFPSQLNSEIELTQIQAGVFHFVWGTDVVRLIVLRDLPQVEHNSPLHLFSATRENVQYARQHFQQQSPSTSSLIKKLLVNYETEGIEMSYTIEDFHKEQLDELRQKFLNMTVEERKKMFMFMDTNERKSLFNSLTGDERKLLWDLYSSEERQEILRQLPIEERLKGLPINEIKAYIDKQNGESTANE